MAPTVVAVARDLELGTPDATLPTAPKDPEALAALAERWGLSSPVKRLTSVLGAR